MSDVDVKQSSSSKQNSSESDSKNRRRKKPKTPTKENEAASRALSAEQLLMLNSCRPIQTKDHASGARTGHVSVEELMGKKAGNDDVISQIPIMNKLRVSGPLTRKTVLAAATEEIPLVPGFPIPLRCNRSDAAPPASMVYRPELFKTTMEAYASASAQHGTDDVMSMLRIFKGVSTFMNSGKRSPTNLLGCSNNNVKVQGDNDFALPDLRPWRPDSRSPSEGHKPHSPTGSPTWRDGKCNSSMRSSTGQKNGNYAQNGNYRPNGWNERAFASPSSTTQPAGGNQKTRKPYFMPYMSGEAVERGLRNQDLLQGVMRVNQRNYEESYIDNPEGDEQLDILILGVHDRNRALHGDVVVVKIKDRSQWVVRDNLYQSWKAGVATQRELPAQKNRKHEASDDRVVCVAGVPLTLSELSLPVPQNPAKLYSRKDMILLGAQMEMAVQESLAHDAKTLLVTEVQQLVESLAIGKSSEEISSSALRRLTSTVVPKRTQQQGNRRASHRLLCDLVEDESDVPDSCLQKTAEVVFISEQKNCRTAMGQLKIMADGNRNWALFSPTDSRMPRMMIPADQLPLQFFDRPQDWQKFIFVAKMVDWAATAQFARGKLERTLGHAGDIDAETEGLLYSNDVDTKEFSSAALSSLPITEAVEWKIDEKEFKYRTDLRDEVIFTIDPATARDLDDALSIEECADVDGKGTPGWKMGVHIADVTHFLLEGTELDRWASERATSVYLVHKVVPMLPRILCEELCSLNPGVDRLCFSVVWKMDADGKIMDEWFGRTIIRSCCKMAYEHAQDIIDNPNKEFEVDELPTLHNGRSIAEVKAKVLQLDQLAKTLRSKRLEGGALRLDQPKLKFSLDEETKMPNGVGVYEIRDSNKLVEEFMLLANMCVAKKIEAAFPKTSVLRRHPPPKQKVLREVVELCDKIGFPINASSSTTLSEGLRRFESKNEVKAAINQVLSMLMMKPMQLAQYFCTGTVKSVAEYHHYALSTPYYTHFTSPIRRYPDVMVHRLLSAAVGYTPPPLLDDVQEISKKANRCNDKKLAAKTVSEQSADTFFGLFVKQCGPLEEKGVVVAVLDGAFDVLVFKYGVVKRVYVNRLEMAREPNFTEGPPPRLALYWKSKGGPNSAVEQVITMCSVVDVILTALPEPTKYQAVIKMRSSAQTHTLAELESKGAESLSSSEDCADAVNEMLGKGDDAC